MRRGKFRFPRIDQDPQPGYTLHAQGQLSKRLNRLNMQYTKKFPPRPRPQAPLQGGVQPDVQRLSDLPGRDLSSWSNR